MSICIAKCDLYYEMLFDCRNVNVKYVYRDKIRCAKIVSVDISSREKKSDKFLWHDDLSKFPNIS